MVNKYKADSLLEIEIAPPDWPHTVVDLSDYDALADAEHQVRCDLMDALFYVQLVYGRFGGVITDGEREIARDFEEKILKRYPQQKAKAKA